MAKPSKLQKHVFYHYKVWERKLISVCFFGKVKTPKRTLEIDDLELPSGRKFSSCYKEGETPVEFASTFEEYYPQNFYSAEVLLWNSLDNGKTAFKSVAWRTFWSWTLLFRNDLDKFKLETQIKTFKNIVDEKHVGIKEAIKIISLLNASGKLLVSEVLQLVKLILLVPTTNAVNERSGSTLCRVCTYYLLVF